jgi:hypothetical protein
MKPVVFAVVFVTLALGGYALYNSISPRPAPGWPPMVVFYAGAKPHRVTIETQTGVVSVINVPAGVLLSVEGNRAASDRPVRGPHRFRGDLILRTRRFEELDARERFGTPNERNASVIMDRALFVLTLRDVDVTVETIG